MRRYNGKLSLVDRVKLLGSALVITGASILGCGGNGEPVPVNNAPVANDMNINTNEDVLVSEKLKGSDLDGDALKYTIVSGPEKGSITSLDPDTGDFTLEPSKEYYGPDSFTFIVNDGKEDSNISRVDITVDPVNDAPEITGQTTLETLEEVPLEILTDNLVVEDPDNIYPDDFTLTLLNGSNYTLAGNIITPIKDFNDSLTVPVIVNDGIDNSPQYNLNVSITPVDDPAVWNSLSDKNVGEDSLDESVVYSGLKNQITDIDSAINKDGIKITSTHTHYDLIFNGDDLVVSDMEANWNDTTGEKVELDYNGVTTSFNLNVNPVNDDPVLSLEDKVVEAGGVIILSASDVEGDSLSFTAANFDSDGNWVTDINDIGNYPDIPVDVSDGNGGSDSGSFTALIHSPYEDLSGKVHTAIISDNVSSAKFVPLQQNENERGNITEIYPIENIIGNYGGRDNAEDLRNFFKQLKLSNPELRNVFLYNGAPLRKAYFDDGTVIEIPTDLYYADLDRDWDANGNSRFGEPGDNVDFWPDIRVGRASKNLDHLIQNILDYMNNINPSQVNEYLWVASLLDALTDPSLNADKIIADHIPLHISNTTNYQRDGGLNLNSAFADWNANPHWIYWDGHSEYFAVVAGGDNIFREDIDANLANDLIGAITVNPGCDTCAKDQSYRIPAHLGDCIAERSLDKLNSWNVAWIGNTRKGKYAVGSPTGGTAAVMAQELYRALFEAGRTDFSLGEIFNESKIGSIYGPRGYIIENFAKLGNNSQRYEQFGWFLFGYPGMIIPTNYLGTLITNINQGTNYTEVNVSDGVNPVEGAKVCLDEIGIYSALTNSGGRVVIPKVGTVNVTKHNYN